MLLSDTVSSMFRRSIHLTQNLARSIIDLDYRLQAWYGGVGPSVMNGLFHMHRSRQISRSVLFGIPLYFIAGEILKLASSSVLGKPQILV